jgi:hypothetical protein
MRSISGTSTGARGDEVGDERTEGGIMSIAAMTEVAFQSRQDVGDPNSAVTSILFSSADSRTHRRVCYGAVKDRACRS